MPEHPATDDNGDDDMPRTCSPVKGHRQCSAYHRNMVDSYRAARDADELSWDLATSGYATESRMLADDGARRPITFKQWLQTYSGGTPEYGY